MEEAASSLPMEQLDREHEQQPTEQPKPTAPNPPEPTSKFVKVSEWEIDNQVPCGFCETWQRKSNIARHCKEHYLTPKEMYTQFYEEAAALYIKRIGEK